MWESNEPAKKTSSPELSIRTIGHLAGKRPLINRSNLRDIIIIICLISAILYDLDWIRLALSGVLLVGGCFFHYMTKGVLIRNVVLCQAGTYRIVRHPYYMANYLIDSGFCLLSGNVYLVLIYPFLFYWAYGPTIRKEEATLAKLYNEDFLRYSLDVPQIFPDAYSIRSIKEIATGFSTQRITRNEISRFMRFWATACFIMFLHMFKRSNLDKLLPFNFSFIQENSQSIALLILTCMLFTASLFIQSKREGVALKVE
ncbi:MAG: methyltransferase family protein [Syntrophorhabdaceae bacterium]